MILSLCQELRELFVAEESCLSDIDSDEDGFEDSRPRDRQISVEYDPDTDDYEMQVSPELPEVIDLKETQLIVKQIAQLETRIDQGGDAQIISHYRKVKSEILLQLAPAPLKDESKSASLPSLSRLSTCDTDLVSMGFPAEANDECEQSDAALEDVSFLAPADLRWFKDAEGMPTMTI